MRVAGYTGCMDRETERLRLLFDEAWYRCTYFPEGRLPTGYHEGYDHYLAEGARAGLSPGPHFDETWYRNAYPEAARAISEGVCLSGYHHFVYEGAGLGLAPNRYFMPRWYLSWYTDARAAVERGEYAHAFEHYLREGLELQLSPNPFFDERWYRQNYQDVEAAIRDGRIRSGHQHFIERGAEEGRQGSTLFDPAWYLARYPEVRNDIESGLARNSYDHFCRYGFAAGKNSCADFDEGWYRSEYADVRDGIARGQWINGLHHFVAEGMLHGYAPLPDHARVDALGYNGAASPVARRELREFLGGGGELDLRCPAPALVSIVVALYNRAALTLRCLRSIAAWAGVPYEVIAVDNASGDETAELLARVRGVRLLRNERNLHFVRACNQGAAAAIGKYLLFLNNDCELRIGAVRSAVAILESETDIGAVGGKILLHDGRLQEAGCYLRPNAFPAQFGRGQDPFLSDFMHRRDVPYCSGSFLMTPHALFQEMGGFDEAFCPAYSEDVDYCLRLWRGGRRVVFHPDSIVEHPDSGALYQRFLYPSVLRNMAVLHKRYREYLRTMPDYGVAPVSSLDGCRQRSACLLLVKEVGGETPAWAGVMRRLLDEKRFVTIYPLRAWPGEREEVRQWLPDEVELVSRRGKDELEAFCRERGPVYDSAVLPGDPDQPEGFEPASMRQWLPGAELVIEGLEAIPG